MCHLADALKGSPGVQVHLLRLMSICLVVQRCPSRTASASVLLREIKPKSKNSAPHSNLNFQQFKRKDLLRQYMVVLDDIPGPRFPTSCQFKTCQT
jgi:hypothetical protein